MLFYFCLSASVRMTIYDYHTHFNHFCGSISATIFEVIFAGTSCVCGPHVPVVVH